MADATLFCNGTGLTTITMSQIWNDIPDVGDILFSDAGTGDGFILITEVSNPGVTGVVTGYAYGDWTGTTTVGIMGAGTMSPDPIGFDSADEPNHDGSSWANACQGVYGLQHVFDSVVVDAEDTDFFVGNIFTLTAKIDLDTSGGSTNNNKWLKIIGCDASGDELDNGLYNIWDGDGGSYHVAEIKNVSNIKFKHIHFYNVDTAGANFGVNAANTGYLYGYVFDHCKTSSVYIGLYFYSSYNTGLYVKGGHYAASTRQAIYTSQVSVIEDAIVENDSATYAAIFFRFRGSTVRNCIIKNPSGYGIRGATYTALLNIHDNVFYNVGGGIYLNDSDALLVEYNNIYFLVDNTADFAIERVNGSILYSDYSACNRAAGAYDGMTEGSNVVDITDTEADTFVDASGDDFRLIPTSVCLNTGKPDMLDGYTDIGLWSRKSFLRYNHNG